MINSRWCLLVAAGLLAFSCSRSAVSGSADNRVAEPPALKIVASKARRVSPDGVKAAESAIAPSPGGSAYLAYVEHHGVKGADLYLQPVNADGEAVGTRVRINETPDTVKAWKGDPPTVVLGGDGAIFVGWTRSYSDPNAKGSDLMLSVSRDGGRTFDPGVKVNDDEKPAAHGMHSLAVRQDGRVIMAWLDERNIQAPIHDMSTMKGPMHHEAGEPNSEVWTAVSLDGGRTFSPNVKIAGDACPCCKTTLLAAADGNVYAGWRQVLDGNHRHIAVANSADGGRSFSPGVVVSDDNWQLTSCPVSGPALSSSAKNEVEVIWFTGGAAGPAGVYFTHSQDGGRTFDKRQLVNDAAKSGTPVFVHVGETSLAVFNEKDGSVKVMGVGEDGAVGAATDLAGASESSAAVIGEKVVAAFTRAAGDDSAVWIQVLSSEG